MHEISKSIILLKIFQRQPKRSIAKIDALIYTNQKRVCLENQTQPRLLWSFLDSDNYYLLVKLNWKPFQIFQQLVTRLVHFQVRTRQIRCSYCIFFRIWGACSSVFCYEIFGKHYFFIARGKFYFILANLHIWIFIWVFSSRLCFVYRPMGMASMDFDGLWNGELSCIFSFEYDGKFGLIIKKREICCIWNYRASTNYPIFDFQISLF